MNVVNYLRVWVQINGEYQFVTYREYFDFLTKKGLGVEYAVNTNNTLFLDFLIKKGFKTDSVNEFGQTPLEQAKLLHHDHVVKLLQR